MIEDLHTVEFIMFVLLGIEAVRFAIFIYRKSK